MRGEDASKSRGRVSKLCHRRRHRETLMWMTEGTISVTALQARDSASRGHVAFLSCGCTRESLDIKFRLCVSIGKG